MLRIQCLIPSDESFLNLVKMSDFIDVYGGDMEDLTHEVYQVKKLLQRTKPVPDLKTMLEHRRRLRGDGGIDPPLLFQ